MLFCSCNLDSDLMTMIHETEPKILKMYPYTKNELSRLMVSKGRALQTDRQTDR